MSAPAFNARQHFDSGRVRVIAVRLHGNPSADERYLEPGTFDPGSGSFHPCSAEEFMGRLRIGGYGQFDWGREAGEHYTRIVRLSEIATAEVKEFPL